MAGRTSVTAIPAGGSGMPSLPAGAPRPTDPMSMASVNAAAALRDYKLTPRLGYSTIAAVSGPLVVTQFVKARGVAAQMERRGGALPCVPAVARARSPRCPRARACLCRSPSTARLSS
jgi:hypothetical protein